MPSSGTGNCGSITPGGRCGSSTGTRNVRRHEMFAVHTPQELQAVIDRIEAQCRGKPKGEQMLADAHWRDADNDRFNHRD